MIEVDRPSTTLEGAMAFRAFRDDGGNEWHVYDVSPLPREDRRKAPRRSGEVVALGAHGDRRVGERRISVGRFPTLVDKGWLCFQHDGECRRLSPIPQGWVKAEDARLTEWLGAARPRFC
jgi:hypothetical protein